MLSAAERLRRELAESAQSAAPAAKPKPVQPPKNGFDLFASANRIDTISILDRLGIAHSASNRGEMATCPGCGEDGALVCKEGGIKCLHDRCAQAGPVSARGFRTNVDLVMLSQRLDKLEAAKTICSWFGIEVPTRANGRAEPQEPEPEPKSDAWEAPVPFDDVGQLPEFPIDALPRVLRDWVRAEAEATQTPPALAASMALAVISAICAKRFEAEIRAGWREPLSMFLVAVLLPGERKSAVFRDATAPIRAWEAQQSKAAEPRIQAALTQKSIRERRARKALEDAAKSSNPADAQVAEELAIDAAEFRVPVVPRICADDVTPEKLAHLLAEHGGRMAIMSAEGGIFDTIAGRYSDGVANLDVLLKGHAGDELRVDRRSSAPLHVRRPAVTLGLCVQPSVLEGLAAKETFRGRGLLARCLFVLPQSKVGRRDIAPAPVPPAVTAEFEQLCTRLLELPERRNANDEIEPFVLRFTPAARQELESFARELEPRLAPGCDLEPIRDWASKLVGAVARIAAILHLADSSEELRAVVSSEADDVWQPFSDGFESSQRCQSSQAESVSESETRRTKEIGSFLLSHALAAFRTMGGDPQASKARILLSWLTTLKTLTTTKSEAQQACRSAFPRAADIDGPLNLLENHGFVRVVERASTSKGGRKPSPTIVLNPLLRTARADTENSNGVGGGS